jgi:predicted metal-dependent hydrolase
MRDAIWLQDRLSLILKKYFSDVVLVNRIEIRFGRKAKTRLGSIIKLKNEVSLININGHFTNIRVPVYVIDAVIAHELSHYAHGFQSDHQRFHRFPHLGGVVTNELKSRGMGLVIKKQKKWIKKSWRAFLKVNQPRKRRLKAKRRISRFRILFKLI